MSSKIVRWLSKFTYISEKKTVNNAIIAGFFVLLLHGSYLLWKLYIVFHPDLHQFVNLAVFFKEIWVTLIIILIFLVLIVSLHMTRDHRKISDGLIHSVLYFISVSMAYQGYTFGSMSLPSGIMLIGATLIGFVLFERRAVYWASCTGGFILILTTVAAIFGWLPYAPKLLDSNFPSDQRAAKFLLLNMLVVVIPAYFIVVLISDYSIGQLKSRTQQLQLLSQRDPLTQLNNRRVVYDYLMQHSPQFDKQWRKHVAIMLDIDFFKKINDQYGHLVGDQVLKYVATVLQSAAQSTDVVSRFGGEEFLVIMPSEDVNRAVTFAARCQQLLSEYDFGSSKAVNQSLSASFGVVCASQAVGLTAESLEQLIALADQALYRAKQAGRARTVVL